MRCSLLFAMGAAVVVLSLPLASAGGCISQMRLDVDVGTVRFDMQQVLDGDEATEIRDLVDEGAGNGDGQIDDQEVAAWESAMTGRRDSAVNACLVDWSDFMDGFVTQDGTFAQTLDDLDATMDLQGSRPATADDPIVLGFSGTLSIEVEGPEAAVTVIPEAFEGLSEMLECIAPDAIESSFAQNPCGDTDSDPVESMRRLEIRPADGARIDGASIQPAVARNGFDGTSILLRDFVASDTLTDIRFRVASDNAVGGIGSMPVTLFAAMATAAGIAGAGAFVVASVERARFRFWWIVSIVGFTRIRREKALEHRRRESILGAIQSEPGVHLGALQRGLGMATGTLVHHLRVLEHAGHVETHRRSNRVHFVPAGHRGPIESTRSMLQERLLETMRRAPGLTQSDLAQRLGEPRNTVAYNVRRLHEDGHVEVQREGRVVRHFVVEDR